MSLGEQGDVLNVGVIDSWPSSGKNRVSPGSEVPTATDTDQLKMLYRCYSPVAVVRESVGELEVQKHGCRMQGCTQMLILRGIPR